MTCLSSFTRRCRQTRLSGAGCEQVAEHLAELERGAFGYSEATAARNMSAAKQLCDLDVRL